MERKARSKFAEAGKFTKMGTTKEKCRWRAPSRVN